MLTNKQLSLYRQVAHDLDDDEGFREFAYPDPLKPLAKKYPHLPWGFKPAREIAPPGINWDDGNPWTVGHGFTAGVTPDSRMTRIQSERKLEDAIHEMDSALHLALPTWYPDASVPTKTVLLNMCHQLGLRGVLQFKNTLNYMKTQQFDKAADGMLASLWARQTPSRVKKYAKRLRDQKIDPAQLAPELK